MNETRPKHKVEFIESYWTGGELGSNYEWSDNHGELVRCKDCKYGEQCIPPCEERYCVAYDQRHDGNWYCADAERRGTND